LVKEQLAKPRALLMLTARIGLQRSEQAYMELGNLLPHQDVVVIDATAAPHLKSLFTDASALETAYSKLATDLMPKSGLDLLDQALTSMASQLLGSLPVGDVTLAPGDLYQLQQALADLSEQQGLLAGFQENLRLAAGIGSVADKTIEQWAAAAASVACAPTDPAASDDFAAYFPLAEGYSWDFTVEPAGAKPGLPKITFTTKVEGREMINGTTYYKVVNLFVGQDPGKAEVNYGRRGRFGSYLLPGTNRDAPEFLDTPSPLPMGKQWTISGPDRALTCSATQADAATVGDPRYPDVIKIDCNGKVGSQPFGFTAFQARGTGTIRQIVRPSGSVMVFELARFHHPG
jgi:hypothetical protein